jgi:Fur family peroxide stress response transcriptional regulator
MLSPEMAEASLKENGCRMTAQRHAVLEILAGNRTHPTAEALVSQVQAKLGYVSPATIYNTLESLEELGFIRRIDGLEQRAHFDPDTSDHQHIICRNCKRVWDIKSPTPLKDLPSGFKVEDILIQGVCEECSSSI